MDQQRISIRIAGFEYPLNVERDQEEVIRLAAARINEKVDEIRDRYQNVDIRDILSIVLLEEEKKLIELQRRYNAESEGIFRKLLSLDQDLDNYLLSR